MDTMISNVAAGNYSVTVTDALGCTAVGNVTINTSSSIVVATSVVNTSCGENNGFGSASATGGSGSYTFAWSNGTTGNMISNVASGSYTVTATDTNGCTGVATITINTSSGPTAAITGVNTSCGENDGSASASATGGSGGYTYVWSTGSTGPTISNLAAGNYSVTVTDSVGCPDVETVTIDASSSPVISFNGMSTTCGEDNGSASVSATGGAGGYTYLWSTGSTSTTISNQAAGTYSVTVTDSAGCFDVEIVTINSSTGPPSLSTSVVNTTCGEDNGSASASASGGSGGFTFAWSNGAIGNMISNVAAGTYTVTVTDSANCTSLGTVTINGSTAGPQIATSIVDTSCGENNGFASVSAVGGNGGSTFVWSNGTVGNMISNVAAGNYSVTATDNAGCTSVASVTIDDSNGPVLATSVVNTTCGDNNGFASASATSGTPGYTFSWSNGTVGTMISNVAAGAYTVTVTDAVGCTAVETVNVGTSNGPVLTTSVVNTTCGDNNGSASASATGGAGGFTFAWSNGTTGTMINNVAAGNYTVTVTDNAGCIAVETVSISSSNGPTVATSIVDTSCGENNGFASASATGGSGGFTFVWSNGTVGTMISNVPAGNYSVTVTDSAGCPSVATVTISTSDGPTSNITGVNTTCGDSNGSASVSATGGSGSYTYIWSTGSTSNMINNLAAGTYSVTVTDSEGCPDISSISIQSSDSPVATATGTNTMCGLANGTASVSATGGSGNYTYLWSNGATSNTINNLPPGNYSVTVTDSMGCTDVVSVVISAMMSPNLGGTVFADLDNDGCQAGAESGVAGVTVTLLQCNANGTTTVLSSTMTDANGSYEFGLNVGPGFICLDPAFTYQTSISNIPSGFNNSTGPGIGCMGDNDDSPLNDGVSMCFNPDNNDPVDGSGDEHIDFGLTPCPSLGGTVFADLNNDGCQSAENGVAGITVTLSQCNANGTTTILSSTVTDANGSYEFGPNAGPDNLCLDAALTYQTSISNIPPDFSNSTGAGIGCPGDEDDSPLNDGVSMCFNPANDDPVDAANDEHIDFGIYPCPTLNVSVVNTTCGDNNGAASASGTGGAGGFTFLWSTGATTNMISNLAAGNYSVTLSDSGGCTVVENFTINGSNSPVATVSVVNTTCGANNGAASVSATGGSGGYSYLWSTGSTANTITNQAAGTYSVTVIDSMGCTDVESVTIAPSTNVMVTTNTTPTSCGEANGTATAVATGGNGMFSYVWSTGATTSIITNLAAGNYTVTVTDGMGCTNVGTASVSSSDSPVITNLNVTDTTCGADDGAASVTVTGGTGSYMYQWSNGATTQSVSNLAAGNYGLTITDSAGCTTATTFVIAPSTMLTLDEMSIDEVCTDGEGVATVAVVTGITPFTFIWSNGGTTASITDLSAGVYSVTVTDAAGCVVSTSITVNNDADLEIDTEFTSTCCGLNNGSASVEILCANGPANILWSTGETTTSIDNLAPGTYTVTVTDAVTSVTETFVIQGSDSPVVTVSGMDTVCGEDNGSATAVATQGTPGYTYSWSNGAMTSSISDLAPGTYVVTVTDSKGCTDVESVVILDSAEPNSGIINGGPFHFCVDGVEDNVSGVTVTGATGSNMTFVITDENGNILGLPPTVAALEGVNFDAAGAGTCFIYHVSYEAGTTGLMPGTNIVNIAGCFDIDGTVEVVRDGLSPVSPMLTFDLDACNPGTDFSEFTATSMTYTGCTELSVVGNHLTGGFSHSCTPGVVDNGICFMADTGCGFNPNTDNKLVIPVSVVPGGNGFGNISGISFYEQAPETFVWTDGNSGDNNYPTLYAVRVLRDGSLIYEQAGIPTSLSWQLADFDFAGNADFTVSTTTTFTFELIPYCAIGNNNTINSIWDIDEIEILSDCDIAPQGGILTGGPYNFCIDGLPDFVSGINVSGAVGINTSFIVTDSDGNVLGLPSTLSDLQGVDFEAAGPGTCIIWHVGYDVSTIGLGMGVNIFEDLYGCFDLSNPINVVRTECGSVIGVYPNPTSGRLMLDIKTQKFDLISYSITDNLGRVVKNQIFDNNLTRLLEIDLSDLPSGHYYLSSTVDGHRISKPIVITK